MIQAHLRRDVLLALVGYGIGAVAGWWLWRWNERATLTPNVGGRR